jgi:hypothetical protein
MLRCIVFVVWGSELADLVSTKNEARVSYGTGKLIDKRDSNRHNMLRSTLTASSSSLQSPRRP